MKLVAGVDIGNATTETAIARIDGKNVTFLSSGITGTTGIKGTKQNIHGVFQSLKNALDEVGFEISDLDEVRINEAAPVIGDVAMETITETIITESTMIGHNPNTPGGVGIGVGISQRIDRLDTVKDGGDVIVVIPAEVSFEAAAALINRYNKIFNITGAIVQRDDGVLINNRLEKKIPIVDEVGMIDKVPLGMLCAVEVAPVGGVVEVLSNPYGIATLFKLTFTFFMLSVNSTVILFEVLSVSLYSTIFTKSFIKYTSIKSADAVQNPMMFQTNPSLFYIFQHFQAPNL